MNPSERDTGQRSEAGGPRSSWVLVAAVLAWCYFAQPLNLFYTLSPDISIDSHVAAIREGSLARQAAILLMGLWAAAWIVTHRFLLRPDGRLAACVLLFLFVVVASIGWADDPVLSAKRAAALLAFSVSCVAIAQHLGVEHAASLAFWGSAFVVGVSAGAELALGTFTPFEPAYRFSGLMHANGQGVYCACLALAGVSLARRARLHAWAYAVTAGIGFVFLLLTKSRDSLGSALVGLACYFALTSARARYWLLVASTAGVIAAVPFVLLGRDAAGPLLALATMGRQDDASTLVTLTGRTALWQGLLQYVSERPLLGFGYGGFWTPERLTAITRREGWVFGSAHSQYFEILLSVGVLGLAAYCTTGLLALWRLVARYWRSGADAYAFAAALIVLLAVDMLANSLPLEPWLPMVLCVTIVAALAFGGGRGGSDSRA